MATQPFQPSVMPPPYAQPFLPPGTQPYPHTNMMQAQPQGINGNPQIQSAQSIQTVVPMVHVPQTTPQAPQLALPVPQAIPQYEIVASYGNQPTVQPHSQSAKRRHRFVKSIMNRK